MSHTVRSAASPLCSALRAEAGCALCCGTCRGARARARAAGGGARLLRLAPCL